MSYLIDYIEQFHNFRVAVIGDLMLDKYIFGKATRISQEAPVPVVCVESEKSVPGGAANVALNLRSLHAKADVFGVVGKDAAGRELTKLLKKAGANTDAIIKVSDRPTTVKTRIIASRQQVVRVDKEEVGDFQNNIIHEQLQDKLESCLKKEDSKPNAIIMEDYAKGVFTQDFMEKIVNLAREYKVPVMLDPHPTHHFNIKGLRMMTPNLQEALALTSDEMKKEMDSKESKIALKITKDIITKYITNKDLTNKDLIDIIDIDSPESKIAFKITKDKITKYITNKDLTNKDIIYIINDIIDIITKDIIAKDIIAKDIITKDIITKDITKRNTIGKYLKDLWGCEIPVITLGAEGMAIFLEENKEPLTIPTRAQKVFDVSGAGDTVMAAMTLGLLAKASPEDAAKIANYAAGIVVGIVGTAAIQYDDLIKDIKNDEILKVHNQ